MQHIERNVALLHQVQRFVDAPHAPIGDDPPDLIALAEHSPDPAGAVLPFYWNLRCAVQPLPVDGAETRVIWIQAAANSTRSHESSRRPVSPAPRRSRVGFVPGCFLVGG